MTSAAVTLSRASGSKKQACCLAFTTVFAEKPEAAATVERVQAAFGNSGCILRRFMVKYFSYKAEVCVYDDSWH